MGNFLVQYVTCSTHKVWWNDDLLISLLWFFFFFFKSARRKQNRVGGQFVCLTDVTFKEFPHMTASCVPVWAVNIKTWNHMHTVNVSCDVKEDKIEHDNESYIEGCAHSHQSVWKYQFLAIFYLIQFISRCFIETQSLKQQQEKLTFVTGRNLWGEPPAGR